MVRILNGEKPGDIQPQTSDKLQLFVNPGAAARQGVSLPQELLDAASEIVQ